jgi:hypothetical protein
MDKPFHSRISVQSPIVPPVAKGGHKGFTSRCSVVFGVGLGAGTTTPDPAWPLPRPATTPNRTVDLDACCGVSPPPPSGPTAGSPAPSNRADVRSAKASKSVAPPRPWPDEPRGSPTSTPPHAGPSSPAARSVRRSGTPSGDARPTARGTTCTDPDTGGRCWPSRDGRASARCGSSSASA